MSAEAPSAPKRARNPWARAAAAVVAGATIGFLYYRFVGCRTGTCLISSNPYVSIDVLLSWVTTRHRAVVVEMDERAEGVSNYTLRKLVTHAVNMMTGFSTIPLQLASWIGFLLTGFGALIFAYVVVTTVIEGGSPPGFPFLACLIAVFSGAQLLCLGIIGEYLGRAHFRLLDRPSYVVRTAHVGAERAAVTATTAAAATPAPPA